MKKRTLQQHQKICTILYYVGAGIILLGGILNNDLASPILLGIGTLVFLSALGYRFITFRCPHCGDRWLGVQGLPDYCPACGKKTS